MARVLGDAAQDAALEPDDRLRYCFIVNVLLTPCDPKNPQPALFRGNGDPRSYVAVFELLRELCGFSPRTRRL